MGHKGWTLLLFLDNAMSHSDIQPCNVRLKFLLANKSIMQPLDCKTTIHGDTNRMKNIAPGVRIVVNSWLKPVQVII